MTIDNVENCNLVRTVLSWLGELLFDNVTDSDLQVGTPRIQSRRKEGWWGRPRASVWLKNKVGVGHPPAPDPLIRQ